MPRYGLDPRLFGVGGLSNRAISGIARTRDCVLRFYLLSQPASSVMGSVACTVFVIKSVFMAEYL